jgi:hypothetical protein
LETKLQELVALALRVVDGEISLSLPIGCTDDMSRLKDTALKFS